MKERAREENMRIIKRKAIKREGEWSENKREWERERNKQKAR